MHCSAHVAIRPLALYLFRVYYANIIFSSLSSSWTIQCSAHRVSLSVDTARAVANHLHLPCMYVSQVDRTFFLAEQLGKCEVKTIFLISNVAEEKAPKSPLWLYHLFRKKCVYV